MRLWEIGLGVVAIIGSLDTPVSALVASKPQMPNSTLGEMLAQQGLEELEDFDYWLNRCNLLATAQKYEEALVACEQGITLRPKNAEIWANHSGILLNLKQYPEAIASADNALKFDNKNSLALTYKCFAFSALTQNEAALDACNEALRVNGNWGNRSPALAWYYRGVILSQSGQDEQALVAYERTLLLEPQDPEATWWWSAGKGTSNPCALGQWSIPGMIALPSKRPWLNC